MLFILKIFKFSFRLFGHSEKRLDKKPRLISKFMTLHTEKQIINCNTHLPQNTEK